MKDLRVTLVQTSLAWEAPEDNRQHIEDAIRDAQPNTDLIVLPEMFSTGFSMNTDVIAKDCAGPTLGWMQEIAAEFDCALAGSIAVRENDRVFNRLYFVHRDGFTTYDKRHLFRMGSEHKFFTPGAARVVLEWRGWRIKPEICYDLRFPVFSRNRGDYDILLNVANWPARREAHWRALLPARAIENLSYVVAVNRIGDDGNGVAHAGASMVIGPRGERLADLESRAAVETVVLNRGALDDYRQAFPADQDADDFQLSHLKH